MTEKIDHRRWSKDALLRRAKHKNLCLITKTNLIEQFKMGFLIINFKIFFGTPKISWPFCELCFLGLGYCPERSKKEGFADLCVTF